MAASPEQLHSALMYCIDFAKYMLEDAGEFLPFGAFISPSGETNALGGWVGDEHPDSAELYQFCASVG